MSERRKRQRTTWQYTYRSKGGGTLRVGWIHNPNGLPLEDVVRVYIRSDGGFTTDLAMTPLEAMATAAGLMLTVQHRGWTGELEKVGLHMGDRP